MNGQHDHHCHLTCNSVDWRIIKCERHGLWVVLRAFAPYGAAVVVTTLDLSNADMDAYCEAALAWDMRADAVAQERARDVRH